MAFSAFWISTSTLSPSTLCSSGREDGEIKRKERKVQSGEVEKSGEREREDETKKRKNRKRLMKRMIFAAVSEHVCVRMHTHTRLHYQHPSAVHNSATVTHLPQIITARPVWKVWDFSQTALKKCDVKELITCTKACVHTHTITPHQLLSTHSLLICLSLYRPVYLLSSPFYKLLWCCRLHSSRNTHLVIPTSNPESLVCVCVVFLVC